MEAELRLERPRLDRLWFRLLLAMSLALALAVGTVGVLVNRATSESFIDYVEDVSAARASRVEDVLVRHYQRRQSWAGVEPIVQLVADLAGQRVVLADSSSQIVADSQQRLIGQRVPAEWQGEPFIIRFRETPVGAVYLDPQRPANRVDNRGQTFLAVTNQYLLWAAAVGLLGALILSLLLSRWLALPLEALTRAARRMEQGDLRQRIDVKIGGEIGALAQAFNSTAASMDRLETLRKQMVTDIAHELRTPMTNIRGYLEAIQDGVVKPDEQTFGILRQELEQLTRLADDLQELALVEAGQFKLSQEEVDSRELLTRVVRSQQPQADARGVTLSGIFSGSLPKIRADAGRLEQVFGNVLRNALAHTPSGGRIIVRARPAGNSLLVTVRDTGSGITAEHLPHIFERFYRGDQARSRQGQGGYGLGLTICRELVQAHGGEISAESTPGEGTQFSVRLPVDGRPRPAEIEGELPAYPIPMIQPTGWFELPRTGVLLGMLFGATAGLIEAGLAAAGTRKTQSFSELFGYAILIDALFFGIVGGLATALAAGLARALHHRFDPVRQVLIWVPVGCLLLGGLAHLRWTQLFSRGDAVAAPRALFAQVAIFGAAGGLALLAGALLRPRRGSSRRALRFGRQYAPIALAVLVGLASVGVARDLGGRELSLGAPVAVASAQPAPSVLLVTIDSLRADHLGSAGYVRARTANLDRLAGQGIRFTNAIANQPNTIPAHASIFTGLYPASHGLRSAMVDQLTGEPKTVAESLAARGYVTAGLFSSPFFEPVYSGLQRGFQHYTDLAVDRPEYLSAGPGSALAATYERLRSSLALPAILDRREPGMPSGAGPGGRADVTTDGAIEWLQNHQARSRGTNQPFFLWVQYVDPRAPYVPPPPYDQIEPDDCADCLDGGPATVRKLREERDPDFSPAQINRLLQYYDGEIAFTDRQLGRLLDTIDALGRQNDTLVVVLGSHGESFGERGAWLHGQSLQDPEIHVPLLLRFPGKLPAGQSVDAIAQQVDVMPTILELLEVPVPDRVEGRGLLQFVHNAAAGGERYAIAELADRSLVSVVTGAWRLVRDTRDGAVRLYRATEDPDSLRDLADAEPEIAAELAGVLDQWREAHP